MTLPNYIAIPELQHNRVRVLGSPLREPVYRKVDALFPGAIHLQAFGRDALVFLWNGALQTPGTGYVDGRIHPEDLEVLRRFAKRAAKGEPVVVAEQPDAFEPEAPVVDLQQGKPAGFEAIPEETPADRPPASEPLANLSIATAGDVHFEREPPRAMVPGLARPEASTSAEIAAALNAHGDESMHAVAIDERTLGFVPRPSPAPALVAAEAPVVDRDVKPGNIAQPEAAPAPEGPMCSTCGERWAEVVCDYPVQPGTCGAQLCTGCAHKLGELDLCPTHATMTFPAVRPPRSEPPMKSADRARRRGEKRVAVSPPAPPLRIPPEAPVARAAGSHANGPDRAAEARRPAGASPSADGSKNLPVYSPRIKLSEGQDIFHASFGIGKVDSVQETRALVIFGSGSRLLACAGAGR